MDLGTAAQSSKQVQRETRTCHYCGKKGHLRSSCFKLQRDQSANVAQQSLPPPPPPRRKPTTLPKN